MILILIGRCFIAAYVLAVAGAFFPVRFSDLGWQQQVLDIFVNAATVPVTGRIFILLAIVYKGYDLAGMSHDSSADQQKIVPVSGLMAKRKVARFVKKLQGLSGMVTRFVKVYTPSLMFIAVAVLQIFVSANFFRTLDANLLNQSTLVTQQATQLRAIISGSNDRGVIQQAVQGFVPEQERESLLSLPIDQQRQDLEKRLNDRESAIRQNFERQRTQRFTSLVVQTTKNILLALIFAWCFFWLRPAAIRAFIRDLS